MRFRKHPGWVNITVCILWAVFAVGRIQAQGFSFLNGDQAFCVSSSGGTFRIITTESAFAAIQPEWEVDSGLVLLRTGVVLVNTNTGLMFPVHPLPQRIVCARAGLSSDGEMGKIPAWDKTDTAKSGQGFLSGLIPFCSEIGVLGKDKPARLFLQNRNALGIASW
jgi:hypothetical protein